MIKVNILSNNSSIPLLRQTPGEKGIWGNYCFLFNENLKDYDFLVVYEDLSGDYKAYCNQNNTLLITGEPPNVKEYTAEFTRQFQNVLTCHEYIKSNNIIRGQQCLPWMAGLKFSFDNNEIKIVDYYNYDFFLQLNSESFQRQDKIAAILSKKNITPEHHQREKFILKLKEVLGDKLDIFGIGFNRIEDKYDVLTGYKYCLVIENFSTLDYWSEKLSDSFLCGALPFYYGCKNILTYFNKEEIIQIDINDFENSIQIIQNSLESDIYLKKIQHINQAKYRILNEYNLFSVLEKLINELYSETDKKIKFEIKKFNNTNKNFLSRINNVIKKIIQTIAK